MYDRLHTVHMLYQLNMYIISMYLKPFQSIIHMEEFSLRLGSY